MGFPDHLAGMGRIPRVFTELAAGISRVSARSAADRLYGLHAFGHCGLRVHLLAYG